MTFSWPALLAVVATLGSGAAAQAQARSELPAPKQTRLQVGVALDSSTMTGRGVSDSLEPGVVWRWRGRFSRADDRWGLAYRLSSFSSQVSSPVGALDLPVADVQMRPLMIGLDYKMPRGRWNWAAGM